MAVDHQLRSVYLAGEPVMILILSFGEIRVTEFILPAKAVPIVDMVGKHINGFVPGLFLHMCQEIVCSRAAGTTLGSKQLQHGETFFCKAFFGGISSGQTFRTPLPVGLLPGPLPPGVTAGHNKCSRKNKRKNDTC